MEREKPPSKKAFSFGHLSFFKQNDRTEQLM